jgi:CheY-like chemotaxis protein
MAEREAKGVLEGRRILVVEDETVIALWVEDVLKQAGATVLGPVASVSEALVLMERETFDCAVLDYKLPDGTITPVADLLVARGLPFIFATGYDEGTPDRKYADWPRVEKAFTIDELLKAIVSILAPTGQGKPT